MKLALGIILLTVIILGIISIQSADAASGRLTIKGESSTIYSNESVYFKGKLTDSEGYAISFERINLWEFVNGEWKYITQGKTDARGNYKITVDANFWNYGKSVNIVANSANSIQSPSMTINIQKPYSYQIKPEVKNDISRNVSTKLVLQVKADANNSVELIPLLTTSKKDILHSNSIKLYFNEEMIGTIPANEWASIGIYKSGLYSFAVKFDGAVIYGTTYQSSSAQMNYQIGDSTLDTKINPPIISNTIKNPTKTNDGQYKDPSYKIKSKYYDALRELESGVKLSENSLSGVAFDNSDAKIKLESAWKIRYMVWGYIDEGKSILRQAESHLKNQDYKQGWDKLHQFDKQMTKAKNHISAITIEIKEGKELEDKYQEKNKTCFLFWCNTKDTTKGLDIKIKDLELKVEKIKNKQKDITLLYQMGVQNQKFVEQEYQSTVEQEKLVLEKEIAKLVAETNQDRMEEEKIQAGIVAKEKQQRLEEQRLQEQREYEAKLYQQEQQRLQEQREYEAELRQQEQQRLQEQREYEVELRQQEIYAEQERQRLEKQRLIDEEKSKIRLHAKDRPLLKGLINGGKLSFYVEPLPYYVSDNVRKVVDLLISELDGKRVNGVTLNHVNSYGSSDFTINWAKDYNVHIGRQIGSHLLVGLGSSPCGSWRPFDAVTVYEVAYHEVGHALGQDHSKNLNNVMYATADVKYEYDYKETITLSDGYWKQIYFCHSGNIHFSTEKSYESSASYKVYVLGNNNTPKNVINGIGEFYPDCSGYKSNWNAFSKSCNVQNGSSLVLYNPSTFGAGADATIKIEIIETNEHKNMNFNFESSGIYYSQDYLGRIKLLFQ